MDVLPVTKILADPVAGPIYQRLLTVLAELGPFGLEEKKTSIHVVRARAFLGVHPRKTALLVNIAPRDRSPAIARCGTTRFRPTACTTKCCCTRRPTSTPSS